MKIELEGWLSNVRCERPSPYEKSNGHLERSATFMTGAPSTEVQEMKVALTEEQARTLMRGPAIGDRRWRITIESVE
jgi:hypothetical protein